jgi:ATP synthase protein I
MAEKGGTNFRLIAEYSAGALELGTAVGGGAWLGYWLDSTFGTGPWLTLLCLLAGVVVGFQSLYRVARRLEKAQGPRDRDGKNG